MTGISGRTPSQSGARARKLLVTRLIGGNVTVILSLTGFCIVIIEQNIMQEMRLEQAKLAMALVDSLGLEGAIFACRANGWDGVLQCISDRDVGDLRDGETQPYHV
jgi:hypothetical protein